MSTSSPTYTLDEIRAAFEVAVSAASVGASRDVAWDAFKTTLPDKRPPLPIGEPLCKGGTSRGPHVKECFLSGVNEHPSVGADLAASPGAVGPAICPKCIEPNERVRGCRFAARGDSDLPCSRCGTMTFGRLLARCDHTSPGPCVEPGGCERVREARRLVANSFETESADLKHCGGCGERSAVWSEDRRPGPDDPCVWMRELGMWVFDCKRQDPREEVSDGLL